MTARRLLSLGIAGCTVAAASPALAQPEMTYEPGNYEYARPAPVHGPVQAPVIYQQQPVVQSIPAPTMSHPVVQAVPHDYVEANYAEYDAEEQAYEQPPHHGGHAYPAPSQQHHAYPAHQGGPAMPPQQAFDREDWLDQCRAQYRRDRRGRSDGGIGGGILGAAIGGVIGNRVDDDGNRLAGTLIGAGVGGIAGAVLGSVIGGSGDKRRAADVCEDYLDRYMAGGFGQQGYYGQGYGYGYHGYAMHMTYVPVLVQVPQRAIVRETVREEWVETSHHHSHARPAKPQKVHYHSAPAPAPKPIKTKTRYIKQR